MLYRLFLFSVRKKDLLLFIRRAKFPNWGPWESHMLRSVQMFNSFKMKRTKAKCTASGETFLIAHPAATIQNSAKVLQQSVLLARGTTVSSGLSTRCHVGFAVTQN